MVVTDLRFDVSQKRYMQIFARMGVKSGKYRCSLERVSKEVQIFARMTIKICKHRFSLGRGSKLVNTDFL